jgi:pentatricopeptide repeat protein
VSSDLINKGIDKQEKSPELARCCRKLSPALKLPTTTSPYSFSVLNHFRPVSISFRCIEEPANHGVSFLSNHPNPEIACFVQKGFSEVTQEIVGRAVHGLCIKGLVRLSVFHSNTLINMYSKFGHIERAWNMFDKMCERNEASWNNMMSGFVRVGLYREAFGFFREMCGHGIKTSGFMIASLVTACDRSDCMLCEGLQVHGFGVKIGLSADVFVGTSLLNFYCSYGLVSSALKHFEEMPERNVVTWTSLIVGYSCNGDLGQSIDIYGRMRREGVCCNECTLAAVISSCGMLGDEQLGNQVLGHVVKSGLETNVSVGNSLISMFGSSGRMELACYVFDHMDKHDTISWNSMIAANAHNGLCEESLRYFYWMRHVHEEIDSTTVSTLLTVCGSVNNLKGGRRIHGLVVKMGLESNVCVCNTLINMYSEAGSSEDAELVFQKMPDKDLISWNSMLTSYVQDEKCLYALERFSEMIRMEKAINHVTFANVLAACSDPEFLVVGKIVHALVNLAGLHDNLIVGNALVTMYGKSGMMVEAKKVFQTMPMRDEVSWNALIGGHSENEESNEAVEAFKLMREDGVPANYITIANVLGACLTMYNLLKHGMPIHAHVVQTGFESDKYVQNSLITMYAKCGDLNSSNYIFCHLADKNSVTWNAVITANAHHGHEEEALRLLSQMRRNGVDLDQFSFSLALAVTANLAILDEGQQLHGLAIKLGFESDHYVLNTAMDMYGKCGEMDAVLRILPLPSNRSRLSWNILISAFARHGCFQKARETFHEMLKLGLKPDHVTFVCLLSACSHAGLVDEGLAYYASMTTEFGVPAGIEHCVCIIDLLGRSGRLAEAETFIKEMAVPANDLVWRSLLAACKIHGNLELARNAAGRLFELAPSDDSAYVLYSNVCATTGRWEDVENVRMQMGSNSIKKKPACSWVKLKNKVSSFGMGDQSHPETEQIYTKLGELRMMIKEAGYVADTTHSLHDIDEEQKEHNLWNHSERIALAFGLINTPKGSPIRIFKNLRVCGDCHSVYKFVSGLVGQKIILRDPCRFLCFSGG